MGFAMFFPLMPQLNRSQILTNRLALSRRRCAHSNLPRIPSSSIKGEVKKKHDAIGWISFCFAARLFEQELF
jgi:hypothetical protein